MFEHICVCVCIVRICLVVVIVVNGDATHNYSSNNNNIQTEIKCGVNHTNIRISHRCPLCLGWYNGGWRSPQTGITEIAVVLLETSWLEPERKSLIVSWNSWNHGE